MNSTLRREWQTLLETAAAAYLGRVQDTWAGREDARRLADHLADRLLDELRQ